MSAASGVCGPCLRVHGSIDNAQRWRGSVLVCVSSTLNAHPAVLLNDQWRRIPIDVVAETAFFMVDLVLPLSHQERTIYYFCDLGALQELSIFTCGLIWLLDPKLARMPDMRTAFVIDRPQSAQLAVWVPAHVFIMANCHGAPAIHDTVKYTLGLGISS